MSFYIYNLVETQAGPLPRQRQVSFFHGIYLKQGLALLKEYQDLVNANAGPSPIDYELKLIGITEVNQDSTDSMRELLFGLQCYAIEDAVAYVKEHGLRPC
jgi:hypothetical protein